MYVARGLPRAGTPVVFCGGCGRTYSGNSQGAQTWRSHGARHLAARVGAMIRIDELWLCTATMDVRATAAARRRHLASCTMHLMPKLGIEGVVRGKKVRTTFADLRLVS